MMSVDDGRGFLFVCWENVSKEFNFPHRTYINEDAHGARKGLKEIENSGNENKDKLGL